MPTSHPHGDTSPIIGVGRKHHQHVVCRPCGAIADVDCAVGASPCSTASDDRGSSIEEAEVICGGRCRRT